MATYTCTVINVITTLNGRSSASVSSPVKSSKRNGNTFTADQRSESGGYVWYHEVNGYWYCQKEKNGNVWLSVQTDNSATNAPTVNGAVDPSAANNTAETLNGVQQMVNARNTVISESIDGSVRLFGLPHQFTPYTDHRVSTTTNLGRAFTETFIFDAPTICIKPGTSNFLPGASDADRQSVIDAIMDFEASSNDDHAQGLKAKLLELTENGQHVKYFDFIPKYSDYMSKVNMLCRICAVFMGLHKTKVPWVNNSIVTFGNYDWAYYSFKSVYVNSPYEATSPHTTNNHLAAFMETFKDHIKKDSTYIQFYVDAGASFSESASNSTTQSALTSVTDQLSSIGKELAFISGAGAGIGGTELDEAIKAGGNAADAWINQNLKGQESTLGNMFKRIFSTSNQLIAGGNFLVPDIWNDSDYGKNYSFTVNLSTPYGNHMSYYLNIMVPLMHILAMALPTQVGANAYTSPNLIRAFSPGWFSCDLGIIDSISIDKGGSGDAWSSNGFPTELKVSVSIRDLYSNLALPEKYSITDFFTNDNLMHYLMVNCGMDITDQNFSTAVNLLTSLFSGSIENKITTPINKLFTGLGEKIRSLYNL